MSVGSSVAMLYWRGSSQESVAVALGACSFGIAMLLVSHHAHRSTELSGSNSILDPDRQHTGNDGAVVSPRVHRHLEAGYAAALVGLGVGVAFIVAVLTLVLDDVS